MIRFIHIPKTGGISVVKWLKNTDIHFKVGRPCPDGFGKIHSTASYWKERHPKKEINMFSIVRNPFTRLVSYYRYIKSYDKNLDLSWEEFVYNKTTFCKHKPWMTQTEYICDVNKKIIVNKILYFENLENELQNFFKINIPLSIENITNTKNINYYESYYKNQDIVSIVKEHFRDDFEKFYDL